MLRGDDSVNYGHRSQNDVVLISNKFLLKKKKNQPTFDYNMKTAESYLSRLKCLLPLESCRAEKKIKFSVLKIK